MSMTGEKLRDKIRDQTRQLSKVKICTVTYQTYCPLGNPLIEITLDSLEDTKLIDKMLFSQPPLTSPQVAR